MKITDEELEGAVRMTQDLFARRGIALPYEDAMRMTYDGLKKADDEFQKMFGDEENPPADECEIAFNRSLTLDEKVSALRAMRSARRLS